MRIIAGAARGRKLFTPGKNVQKPLIRPTSDKARQAIFNILGKRVEGSSVLDLFAGTGAMGLEAISRGARSAVFVDQLPEAIALIKKNCLHCGFWDNSVLVKRDLTKGLFFLKALAPPEGFDLIFLDPPYGKEMGLQVLAELGRGQLVSNQAVVIAEDFVNEEYPEESGCLMQFSQRHYGETGFWCYRVEQQVENESD